MALEQEMDTFQRELARMLGEGLEGKVVLIKGDEVIGAWPTMDEALEAGYEKFNTFLAKEIVPFEKPQYFSRRVTRCP